MPQTFSSGTTAEPGSNTSPQWTIERDVTEYAPEISLGPRSVRPPFIISSIHNTRSIYGRAQLDFYPATSKYKAPPVADAVYPLSGGPDGGYVYLDTPTDQMTGTFTFPTNVDAAYLDVFLESQGGDEFWYPAFPTTSRRSSIIAGIPGFAKAKSRSMASRREPTDLSMDLHRRRRSVPLGSDTRRGDAQLRAVPHKSNAVCGTVGRRESAYDYRVGL